MGGAVSAGRDNNELIDNLLGSNYIRSRGVELAFRALDRADYMLPGDRARAYKDLAWRSGALHLSAPCIYSEVLEGLELRPGLSFLNVGSGTGYLSTLAGLLLGPGGLSHGVEIHPSVLEYANMKLRLFMENSPSLDEFNFCEPKFYLGNGLCLTPLQAAYDRVYCGAGCPEEYQNYFKQLIRVGGVLVMPLNDSLLQVRRVSAGEWRSRTLLSVSFASLRASSHPADAARLDELAPPRLQQLARGAIRSALRAAVLARHPRLRAPPRAASAAPPPRNKASPRRICIPLDDDSDDPEGLNALHDLDRATGANEMNALLSLVLSMGQNRVAGALRFDPLDSSSGSDDNRRDDDDDDDDDDDGDDDDAEDNIVVPVVAEVAVDDLEDMNRVIHRAMHAAVEPRGEHEPRGRLSLTLEYSAGPPPEPSGPSPPDAVRAVEPAESDSPADGRRDRKRNSRGAGDACRCEEAGPSAGGDGGEGAEERAAPAGRRGARRGRGARGKRLKVDSGLGEDCTPSSEGTPPPPGRGRSSSGSSGRSRSPDLDKSDRNARRRLPKRSRSEADTSSSSASSESLSRFAAAAAASRRKLRRSRRAAASRAQDARRTRLSLALQRSVRALPLPLALQVYVNMGRAFTKLPAPNGLV